jgi:hypothetical protein
MRSRTVPSGIADRGTSNVLALSALTNPIRDRVAPRTAKMVTSAQFALVTIRRVCTLGEGASIPRRPPPHAVTISGTTAMPAMTRRTCTVSSGRRIRSAMTALGTDRALSPRRLQPRRYSIRRAPLLARQRCRRDANGAANGGCGAASAAAASVLPVGVGYRTPHTRPPSAASNAARRPRLNVRRVPSWRVRMCEPLM